MAAQAVLGLVVVIGLSSGGCGWPFPRVNDERRATPLIQGHIRPTVALSEADRGRTATVPVGGTLGVRLEACAGCPFVWVQAEKLQGGVLATLGRVLERDPAIPEGGAGGGGLEVFVYRGLKPGEQLLRFYYSDGQSRVEKEASFRIVVR